ncbi:MAG: hypothetical protein IJT92_01730 [Spirochaetia bacterium]|nr:hypothetical protein [Spirochaetia bacterium]
MPIDKSKITNDMLEKAANCKTADDLIALAKTSGIEITKAEAEAYLDELQNVELKDGELKHIAGGKAPGGGDKSIPPESRY